MPKYAYGWKKQPTDTRDHFYELPLGGGDAPLPESVDLRKEDSTIYNQDQTNSCVGNSTAGLIEFVRRKEKFKDFIPSRLFLYYNARLVEGNQDQDDGAIIRDAVAQAAKVGICPESDWVFNTSKITKKPSKKAYSDAAKDLVIEYKAIEEGNLTNMKACLASGYPFIFGMSVYANMESDEASTSGVVNMPAADEEFMGGHAIMCVGYDDKRQVLIIRNSWGADWGDHGYFYLPYGYISNPALSSDFWTIRRTES